MIKHIDKNIARNRRHARIREHVLGTASCPRISVFRSHKGIYVQLVDDVNHVTIASSSSLALGLIDGGNVEGAKKVGADIAKKALKLGIETAVFDRSGYLYHGRVKAVAESAREAGLKF